MRGVQSSCALALLAPLPALAQDSSQDGAPGMGERARVRAPDRGRTRRGPGEASARNVRRGGREDVRLADSDRSGLLTLAELRAVIETRKDAAIRGRFASVDADRNQSVSFAEFNQWQRSLRSACCPSGAAAATPSGGDCDDACGVSPPVASQPIVLPAPRRQS
jgi:hypothetical protein